LLSQIQAEGGDLKNAILSANMAVQLNPQEPILHSQLGMLEYNNSSYSNAIKSLQKAVELNGDYSNARYFLGLAYARIGKDSEAINEFELLSQSNPENIEISNILADLLAGRDIFRTPQVKNASKSTTLPIEE
jgi:tetratricopeptide (TPR) repeat protein